jgi:Uma2 family endonuclease
MGTPALVLEILSDTTKTKDLVDKLNTYRLSGVQEYWIVDPKQENIIVYTFADHEIESYQMLGKGESAQSVVFAGLGVKLKSLFSGLAGRLN